MENNMNDDNITVTISNRLHCLKWLYPICDGVLKELPISDSYRNLLMVAISEGFTNAFQHGNQKEPATEIKLTLCIREKSLKIMIEDEGILPITESINQLCKNSSEESTSGRGLYLMKKIADYVHYERDKSGKNILTIMSKFSDQNKVVSAS
jgi:anti-sigma regulatory factor (Ser/Thr protein kinase)